MFSQLFGDPCDASNEGNIYSALEFNANGNFLASGDRGGRVVIYERNKNIPKKVQVPTIIDHFDCRTRSLFWFAGICYGYGRDGRSMDHLPPVPEP